MIKGKGFTAKDDIVYPPIEFKLDWRDKHTGRIGDEVFKLHPRISVGALIHAESDGDDTMRALILDPLFRDDGEYDADGEQKPGTSSYDRFVALLDDPVREVPGTDLGIIMGDLYVEYNSRRLGTAPVPTTSPAPPTPPPLRTGGTSTAKRSGKGSTSRRPTPPKD